MSPKRWQVVALVVALCFVSGVVGWMIARPSDPKFNDVDVGFLSDMQFHHGGAVGLGFEYLENQHDPLITHYAREIIVGQSQEIATMNSYLDQARGEDDPSVNDDVAMDWMGEPVPKDKMPGMPTDADVERLRAATGLGADDVFTELMIKHHAGGVAMADYAAEHGPEIDLQVKAASVGPLVGGIVAMGAGGVFVLSGLLFIALADLNTSTSNSFGNNQSSTSKSISDTYKVTGYVCIGLGAAAAIVGLIVLTTRSHEPRTSEGPHAAPAPQVSGRADTFLGDVAAAKPRDRDPSGVLPAISPLTYTVRF